MKPGKLKNTYGLIETGKLLKVAVVVYSVQPKLTRETKACVICK